MVVWVVCCGLMVDVVWVLLCWGVCGYLVLVGVGFGGVRGVCLFLFEFVVLINSVGCSCYLC